MIKIYHNPRCSKSRVCLQLLQRPIVISGEKMLIARPPEKVLEIING